MVLVGIFVEDSVAEGKGIAIERVMWYLIVHFNDIFFYNQQKLDFQI